MELSSARQPICSWSQASRNFAIHIPPEVIGRLATESLVAFKRVPRRGLEIGGILLGRTEVGEHTTTFWIEGFQPIESEHRSGPSYVLSDADFPRLQAALAHNGTATLGIYRSQTRSEQLAVQNHDIDLFARCFDSGDALFLMLAPMPGKAAFFYRADGEIRCVHEFALVSSLLAMTPRPGRTSSQVKLLRQPSSGTQAAPSNGVGHIDFPGQEIALNGSVQHSDQPPPLAVVKTQANLPEEATPSRGFPTHRVWRTATDHGPGKILVQWFGHRSTGEKGLWALAAIAVFILTVGVLSYSLRRPSAPDPVAPQYLQLSVDRAGTSLRLHWDPNSSAIRGAARAILHIQDGGQESYRNLAPSEFKTGSIAYEPKSAELTFRLELYSGEPHTIGLVQVMFPQSPVPQAVAAAANLPPRLKSAPIAPVPTNQSTAGSEAQPASHIDSKALPASHIDSNAPSAPHNDIERDENRRIHIAGLEASAESEIARVEKTSLEAPVSINFDRPPRPSPNAPAPEVSVSDQQPSVRVSTGPVEGSRLRHFVGKIPVLRRMKKPVKVAAPVPVYQAKPTIKMPDTAKLTRPVTIDVKVNVAESGAVDRAEVVEYGNPPNFTLANAALAAARQWTFEASRVEDGPIASEVILHFYFSP